MNATTRISPEDCVRALCATRYAEASVIFLAGSVVRKQETSFSDLDLVVVYTHLPHAYRESFVSEGWPVEAFVHDPQTLNYFIGTDRASGVPTLASMLTSGIELPASNEVSRELKRLAAQALDAGPPIWSARDRDLSRYIITDLIEDLRAPRSNDEFHASAARLYELLATHVCRSRGLWSARGKAIVRRLHEVDAVFAEAFTRAFAVAFATADPASLIALGELALRPDGGFLFDGYRVDAPPQWRSE